MTVIFLHRAGRCPDAFRLIHARQPILSPRPRRFLGLPGKRSNLYFEWIKGGQSSWWLAFYFCNRIYRVGKWGYNLGKKCPRERIFGGHFGRNSIEPAYSWVYERHRTWDIALYWALFAGPPHASYFVSMFGKQKQIDFYQRHMGYDSWVNLQSVNYAVINFVCFFGVVMSVISVRISYVVIALKFLLIYLSVYGN